MTGEKQIIKAVTRGDRSAMADLYSRYVRYLAGVCSRYILDQEDLKDVLQSGFVKIFTSIGNFEYRGEGSLKAWMTRIVVNEALKYIRDTARPAQASERDIPDLPDEEPEIEDIPPEVIHAMIRELPQGYRTVFNLFVFEQKSHKEIALLLGISESTSASQFHRARNLLAQKIKVYRQKEGL